jgi:polysaccharide deacetylase 2 family uncharacterized protein YibQ
MPKRRRSPTKRRTPLLLGLLAVLALLIFVGGELVAFVRSDFGHMFLWRHLHVGARANVVRIVGRHARAGLAAAGVPAARIHEEVLAGANGPALRWRVELPRDGSPTQANFAVTQAVEKAGAEVLSGREESGRDGAQTVKLTLGLPGRPTHELLLVRAGVDPGTEEADEVRIALVLFGLADDPASAAALLARAEPFAVIAPAVGKERDMIKRLAHDAKRELVLQVPMEPEDYPRANPGPGTLLVNMPPSRIGKLTREYLEQAGTVAAVANLQGSFAAQDEPFMAAFYKELKRDGISFLHISPPSRSVARPLAARLGVAYDEPDAILDDEARSTAPRSLERAWESILERAKHRHQAVVLLRATPTSVQWARETLAAKKLAGVRIVPLSSVIHRMAKG